MTTTNGVPRPSGLTDEEALFAEAVLGGAKSLSVAARAAGKSDETARVWGNRAIRRRRVKAYMDMLRASAGMLATTHTAVIVPDGPVARAADVMRKLTEYLNADIGSVLEFVDEPGLVDIDGKPVKRAVISLEKAMERGVTHLIEEVSITKDGIRVKFPKKMDAINALIRVLGMEGASEADKAKERAAVADALAKLPPEVLEQVAKHSLGPVRAPANGNGNGHGSHG